MNPLVSIIIPSYNYGKYIKDCIQSCLDQSHKNIELQIVDDASTDNSVEVVRSIKDERIHFIVLPVNKGYSNAKNQGIISAKGEFIVHLDADDMLTPDSISNRLKPFMKDKSLQIVHGLALPFGLKQVLGTGNESYDWCLAHQKELRLSTSRIHAQGVMLRRSVFVKYGIYDTGLRSRSDKEMWIRLLDIVKVKALQINKAVAFYRKHKSSMLEYRKKNRQYNRDVTKIFNDNIERRRKEGITKANTRFMT